MERFGRPSLMLVAVSELIYLVTAVFLEYGVDLASLAASCLSLGTVLVLGDKIPKLKTPESEPEELDEALQT